MILMRLGNKRRMAAKLLPLFPEHSVFIEPFFGAGGLFFSKPKSQYNLLNDSDEEVFNLFWVVRERLPELQAAWQTVPYHESLWNHWKKNEETCPVWRACRFLMLSNCGYMGKPDTLKLGMVNTHRVISDRLAQTSEQLRDCQFTNCDFEKAIPKINFRDGDRDKARAFVYCDPPYLGTTNNYQAGFTVADAERLFACLVRSGIRFALSEFNHPVILGLAHEHGLQVTSLGERKNLKSRRTEILVTNYELPRIATVTAKQLCLA